MAKIIIMIILLNTAIIIFVNMIKRPKSYERSFFIKYTKDCYNNTILFTNEIS